MPLNVSSLTLAMGRCWFDFFGGGDKDLSCNSRGNYTTLLWFLPVFFIGVPWHIRSVGGLLSTDLCKISVHKRRPVLALDGE